MTGRDQFIMGFTFLMGVLVGGYFYVTSFAPTVANAPGLSNHQATEVKFVVSGEQYGGCQRLGSCPSFQLSSNGAYRYIPVATSSELAAVLEGTLPSRLRNELVTSIERANLGALAVSAQKDYCNSFVDGTDYVYQVRVPGVTYELDSCQTRFDTDGVLGRNLTAIWDYLAEPETVYPLILEAGLSGYLESRFQSARE